MVKNIISVSTDDLIKLYQWKEINTEKVRNFFPVLDEFIVNVKDSWSVHYKYNLEHKKLYCAVTLYGGKMAECIYYQNEEKWHCKVIDDKNIEDYFKHDKEIKVATWKQEFITLPCVLMAYFLYYKEDIEETEETKQRSVKVKGKYKYSGKVYIKNYKLYNIKTKDKVSRARYKRSMQAWGVRGHFRHLPNGKTIFINPYVKGKNRNMIDKEYILKVK